MSELDDLALGTEDSAILEDLGRTLKGARSGAALKRALESNKLLAAELRNREGRAERAEMQREVVVMDAVLDALGDDVDESWPYDEELVGITEFRRGFDYLIKKIERGALDHAFILRHGVRVCIVVSPQRWRILKRYRTFLQVIFDQAREKGVDPTKLFERLDDPSPIRGEELPPIEHVPAAAVEEPEQG